MVTVRGTTATWLKRIATVGLLALVAYLVTRQAREMDWPAVAVALQDYGLRNILIAFAIAVPGLLACASFDLIGRQVTGHGLSLPRVMLISFTGYCFSLNLGALVGGLAFRYRLYLPYGLGALRISQVIGLSVLTNWLGYVLVAGVVLTFRPPDLAVDWAPDPAALRWVGALFVAAGAAYVVLCITRGGTRFRMRGATLTLPGPTLALAQYGLSFLSWAAIGAIITWLIPGEVSWFTIMPVLMVSAIAGVWSHVPGGLGVTELVFLTMLKGSFGESEILAALVVFRAVYYVLPFMLAVFAFGFLESTAKKNA